MHPNGGMSEAKQPPQLWQQDEDPAMNGLPSGAQPSQPESPVPQQMQQGTLPQDESANHLAHLRLPPPDLIPALVSARQPGGLQTTTASPLPAALVAVKPAAAASLMPIDSPTAMQQQLQPQTLPCPQVPSYFLRFVHASRISCKWHANLAVAILLNKMST